VIAFARSVRGSRFPCGLQTAAAVRGLDGSNAAAEVVFDHRGFEVAVVGSRHVAVPPV
jgi:hypothetical protein